MKLEQELEDAINSTIVVGNKGTGQKFCVEKLMKIINREKGKPSPIESNEPKTESNAQTTEDTNRDK